MVTVEVQRLQGLIANREAQIRELTPILRNLDTPRTGLKIEVSDARAQQANAIRTQITGMQESLVNLKADLLEEQLKPDLEIEQLIIGNGLVLVEPTEKPNNTLRNSLIAAGVLLLIL